MSRAVLWDSSAILAVLDRDDACHESAVEVASRIAAERRPSFLTCYAEAETHALLLRKLGRTLALEWLLRAGLPVVKPLPKEEARAREILVQHDDKDFSLCDALSFAVIESRRVSAAFSFDRHFVQYGRFPVLGSSTRRR